MSFSTISSQNASQKSIPNNTTKAGVVVETMSAPNPVSDNYRGEQNAELKILKYPVFKNFTFVFYLDF